MARSYLQLTYQDRVLISHWNAKGLGVCEISRRVGIHKSTISRELKRNAQIITPEEQLFYLELPLATLPRREFEKRLGELRKTVLQNRHVWNATDAQRTRSYRLHCANQLRRRKSQKTRNWVIQKLKQHWSPEQIAGRSKIDAPEPVSYEFVYRLLIDDRKRGGKLYRLLKRFGRRKQRLGKRLYPSGPVIPNRTGIEHRPKGIDRRSRIGDLEGDLVQGYRHSGYVLSVVDRKSKLLVLRKLKTKRKTTVRIQLERAIKKMGGVHTLTVDNGSEFCDHELLTAATQVPIYFTNPYSSFEKGTIENSNALIRHFLPKKTRFTGLTQTKLNQIEASLNQRPRKCLQYLTPEEFHSKEQNKISKKQLLHL